MIERKINTESPFVYHSDMVLVRDNLYRGKKNRLSLGGFLRLEEKNVINEFDRQIIMHVLDRGYVTRKCLNLGMESNKDSKQTLRKLCENGVLERYHYVYEHESGVKRTVNFYGLADAAKKASVIGIRNSLSLNLNKNIRDFSYDYILDNPVSVLKVLEYNIMDVSLMNEYGERIVKRFKNFQMKKGSIVYDQPYMYNVYGSGENNDRNNYLIIPVVARRNQGWRKELFNEMNHILECVTMKFGDKTPILIVNTEDNKMACEAAGKIKDYPLVNAAAVFFISDWGVSSTEILENLLNIIKPEKEMYEIIQLQL